MKRKAKFISILFITAFIIIMATYIHSELKYTNQNERIQIYCIDCLNDATDFLSNYKSTLQEKDLYMAAGCFYSFVKIYESAPDSMYISDLHLLINKIWLKLYLESNISEKEIDILIKGISILAQDINSLEGKKLLIQFLDY